MVIISIGIGYHQYWNWLSSVLELGNHLSIIAWLNSTSILQYYSTSKFACNYNMEFIYSLFIYLPRSLGECIVADFLSRMCNNTFLNVIANIVCWAIKFSSDL